MKHVITFTSIVLLFALTSLGGCKQDMNTVLNSSTYENGDSTKNSNDSTFDKQDTVIVPNDSILENKDTVNTPNDSIFENKDSVVTDDNIITLYDKDYVTIQNYIQGRWQLLSARGGINGNTTLYWDDVFQEFTSDNKIIRWKTTTQIRDTVSYFWQRYPNYYSLCDYVDIMCVFTPPHPPHQRFIFYMIKNDTLMYGDAFFSEPFGYNLIKINE